MALQSPLPVRNGVGATRLHLPLVGEWATIAEYVVARFGHLSAESLYARFDDGDMVAIDGTSLTRHSPIGSHEFIWYYRDPPVEKPVPFDEEIIYIDDDLIVIDKPHFLPTTPGGQYLQNSALVRLRNRLDNPDITPIHRLDRATAGLLMFSARAQSRGPYQLMFENRQVQKTYEAVSLAPEDFDLTAPALAGLEFPMEYRNYIEKLRHRVTVVARDTGVPNSSTHIELIAAGESQGFQQGSFVIHTLLKPYTGRMHQLRVHLAALGAGIMNDSFYPVLLPEAPDDYSRPLQLLARELEFIDPLSGEERHFVTQRTLKEAPAA